MNESDPQGNSGEPSSTNDNQAHDSSAPANNQVNTTTRSHGNEPIDFSTATPEQVEARFNNIYGQMQRQDRELRSLRQYKDIAAEQSKAIDELRSGMHTVVDHLQTDRYADIENHWRSQMQSAHERGDTRAFLDAQDKLIDIRTEKRDFERQQRSRAQNATQQQSQEPQQKLPSASEMGNRALNSGDITQQDMRGIEAWQNERGTDGNVLRPWAHNNNPSDPDPDYVKALLISKQVFTNPQYMGMTAAQKLAEVDKRMGISPRNTQGGQQVMSANLTNGRRSGKLSLSDEQKKIAVRMKSGGSKAKSDSDHIEAYRKQLETIGNKRSARA